MKPLRNLNWCIYLNSENGLPLTVNVVFVSQQRFFARKAALASPKARLATEGDWPASADWRFSASCEAASLPGMFFPASLLRSIFGALRLVSYTRVRFAQEKARAKIGTYDCL